MNESLNQMGSYALLLNLSRKAHIVVGKLGSFDFPTGEYVYTGSAFGPGGLAARLKHHFQPAHNPHWHIDYLRTQAKLNGYIYEIGVRRECSWSQKLLTELRGIIIAPGFGSSDCRQGCAAHLIHFPHGLYLERLRAALEIDRSGTKSFY